MAVVPKILHPPPPSPRLYLPLYVATRSFLDSAGGETDFRQLWPLWSFPLPPKWGLV